MRESIDVDVQDFDNRYTQAGVYARFYYVPVEDKEASLAEGRPMFKDRAYVEIICAGNANNIIRRPVTDVDKRRFNVAYGKFLEGAEEQLNGTPLTEITWISKAQVEELFYLKVRTLEQLADLNDQVCNTAPGLYSLKRKAAVWLKKSEDAAPFAALHKENEELRARLEALEKKGDPLKVRGGKSKE
jgi:hypothetical protein